MPPDGESGVVIPNNKTLNSFGWLSRVTPEANYLAIRQFSGRGDTQGDGESIKRKNHEIMQING
jgi:hypothetical protein